MPARLPMILTSRLMASGVNGVRRSVVKTIAAVGIFLPQRPLSSPGSVER